MKMNHRPTTVEQYIAQTPKEALPHLHQLRGILQDAAPLAQEILKWGSPFFVEPRFLFSYSAYKAHLGFYPHEASLEFFREELQNCKTTKRSIQFPYNEPLMEDLIRRIAEYCVAYVQQEEDQHFW